MKMQRPHQQCVHAQSQQHPSLRDLRHFLAQAETNSCRIVCIEFAIVGGELSRSVYDIGHLDNITKYWISEHNIANGRAINRLLIVEDLNKDVIEALGSTFDIDPLFFSNHIDHPRFNSPEPSSTTGFPSKAYSQNFVTLRYNRGLEFEDTDISRT